MKEDLKGYIEYNKTKYFFVFCDWDLILYPLTGPTVDFNLLMEFKNSSTEDFLPQETLLGYDVNHNRVQFCGVKLSVGNYGNIMFEIDYYLCGGELINNVKIQEIFVYSESFNKIFPISKYAGFDTEYNLCLKEKYKKLDFGTFSVGNIIVTGGSSESLNHSINIPFKYDNYIAFKTDDCFNLEKCINLYYSLVNSIKFILDKTYIGMSSLKLIFEVSDEDGKQYKDSINMFVNSDSGPCELPKFKPIRNNGFLDNNFAKLIEAEYNEDIYIKHITERKRDNSYNISRIIFVFAAIEHLIKKHFDEYKTKYSHEYKIIKYKEVEKFSLDSSIKILIKETDEVVLLSTAECLDNMCKRLVEIRTSIAHGDMNIEITSKDIDYIKLCERMIYVMTLKNCKFKLESIKNCYEYTFGKRYMKD